MKNRVLLSRAVARAGLISVILKPAACKNTISLCMHAAVATSTANKDIFKFRETVKRDNHDDTKRVCRPEAVKRS